MTQYVSVGLPRLGQTAPTMQRIRVMALTPDDSSGWDLTEDAEGLVWSSVNPGGDERCSFRLRRSWSSGAPEVRAGNKIIITDGPEILWGPGRIDDGGRSVDSTEVVSVTAFGPGIVLKEGRMSEVYVDHDLAGWGQASLSRQIAQRAASPSRGLHDSSVAPDTQGGNPSLVTGWEGPWVVTELPTAEGWYDAGQDNSIRYIYYEWSVNSNVGPVDPNWTWATYLSDDDAASTLDTSGDLNTGAPTTGTGTLTASDSLKRYAIVQLRYDDGPAGNDGTTYEAHWKLTVIGTSLEPQGSGSDLGFTADQIMPDIVSRTSVTARRIDPSSFLFRQLAFKARTSHEDAITEVAKLEPFDWGTWGTDDTLQRTDAAYFDWTAKDTTTAHWLVRRAECEDIDLQTELSSLFDSVDVHWRDTAGVDHVTTRTTSVDDLDYAQATRTSDLDGGTLTDEADAELLGDAFLALSGDHAPARGSITMLGAVAHFTRGELDPWHMKADGSNIRVADVLPARELIALDDEPDRRSTFPIKHVEVDCSGAVPRVQIDVDQTRDLLSTLQARLNLGGQLALGSS